MPHIVHAPHLNRNIVLGGRKRPKHPAHAVKLRNILRTAIDLPATTNRRAKADKSLREMFLNDTLGDCVIAGRGHRIGELTGFSTGSPFVYSKDQILTEYERIGGYDPKDPSTDQGCDMTVAANDGVQVGYADGSKDVGWVSINAADKNEVMTAIYLFEVGDLGTSLPDAWISPFPSADGFKWDVAGKPNDENGHCYQIVDYDTDGVWIDTWGLYGKQTWKALAKYNIDSAGGEFLVHLNQDQLVAAIQKSPDGVAWGDLIAAFNAMGGNVQPIVNPPAPPAPPGPTPVPAPPAPSPEPSSSGPTLSDALGYLDREFKHARRVMNKDVALKTAQNALAKHWPQ